MEKIAELDKDNELGKFKGRVVFGGDQVKDQDWQTAMFQELTSSPVTMEISRWIDAIGLLPGNVIEQADAQQVDRHPASTQTPCRQTPSKQTDTQQVDRHPAGIEIPSRYADT